MSSVFEKMMQQDEALLFKKILETQTKIYGIIDIPSVVDLITKQKAKTILDVGCGEGSFLFEIAKKLTSKKFIGLEHNSYFLEQAEKNLKKLKLKNVSLVENFFSKDKIKNKFDVVMARYVLMHCSDIQQFLNTAYKQLNKGGLFIGIECFMDLACSNNNDPIWSEYLRREKELHKNLGADSNVPKNISLMLEKAGFKNIRIPVHLYSPVILGRNNFKQITLLFLAGLCKKYPNIFDNNFIKLMEKWINEVVTSNKVEPYLAAAHITASRK